MVFVSLGTGDLNVAKAVLLEQVAAFHRELARLRELEPRVGGAQTGTVLQLTDAEIERLCQRFRTERIAADERDRVSGLSAHAHQFNLDVLDAAVALLRQNQAHVSLRHRYGSLDTFLRLVNLYVPRRTPSKGQLARRLQESALPQWSGDQPRRRRPVAWMSPATIRRPLWRRSALDHSRANGMHSSRTTASKLPRVQARALLFALAAGSLCEAAAADCRPGVYGNSADAFVVIGASVPPPASGQRYLFLDGRRGVTGTAGSPVACDADMATVILADGEARHWARQSTRETDTTFVSAATGLSGRLVEPSGPPDTGRPLVVMVHGSEKSAAIGSVYAYMFAAQGVSAFVYDKRGTGASGGEYTQNFELLADDAAAALQEARRLAAGRFLRSGFFGGSQGGWVAPLAALRSPADFVAVGFGLVVSPIEEDREQLLDEARQMKLNANATAMIERLSQATATLVRSHFVRGYEQLARVRREIGDAPWAKTIRGEYSGDMLRMRNADLRRIGRARFDNLELLWDYSAVATLRKLKVPLLWVLAAEDREAPVATTRTTLQNLMANGMSIEAYQFPDTDHGMVEFRTNADGSRTATRITEGYLRLLADWVKLDVEGPYGRAQKLR